MRAQFDFFRGVECDVVKGFEAIDATVRFTDELTLDVSASRGQGLTLEKAQAALGLEQRFPYMRDAKVFQGTADAAHAANVAAVWKLVQE